MPARQIRKNPKHKSRSRGKRQSRKHFSSQRGGDAGRYVLPPAYFGNGTKGYYADGSTELNSCGKQNAVSQGVISADGKLAGPNLYPMLGGGCSCSGKRNYTSTNMRKNKSHKSRKTRKH